MSLKNALETARKFSNKQPLQSKKPTRRSNAEMKKKKGTKAGGEDKDVEVTADGDGAKAADGQTTQGCTNSC